MQPLISVIIPVYNSGYKIDSCIKSILSQTYKNIEIVLVDDKSPDNITIDILRKWNQTESKIRLLEKPENVGNPRLDGVKIAKGEYICFADQDDWMPENALKTMLDSALENNADLVIGQTSKAIKIGPIVKCFAPQNLHPHTGETLLHEELMDECYESYFGHNIIPVSVWAKLYKKTLLEKVKFTEPWPKVGASDLLMSLSIHPYIDKMRIIPDVVYYYFIGMPGNSPKYLRNWLTNACKLFEYKWNVIDENNITQAARYQAIEMINYVRTYVHLCTIYDSKNREKRIAELGQALSAPIWQRVLIIGNEQSKFSKYVKPIINNEYVFLYEDLEKQDINAPLKEKIKHLFLRLFAKYKMFA